jgi:hypothetical protein
LEKFDPFESQRNSFAISKHAMKSPKLISPIDQAETRKEAPMTVNATPAQTASSPFVFSGDTSVKFSIPTFPLIRQIPSQCRDPRK